jgi:NAD(P)H-hydrate epimerase
MRSRFAICAPEAEPVRMKALDPPPTLLTRDNVPRLPSRDAEGHKGTYGHAVLLGGSRGMAGSIGLAGMSALRAGAGLVSLGVPDGIWRVVSSYEPSYMLRPLADDGEGRLAVSSDDLEAVLKPATVAAIGPGLGQSETLTNLVGSLFEQFDRPLLVDADALNALAKRPDVLGKAGGPRVLTPHPGEFTRLMGGQKLAREQAEWLAVELAGRHGLVVVLKGHGTLVTDGQRTVLNTTGNPGMGTGGTGDVLTGLITGLLSQGLSAFEAACLGVFVHGLAGDLAAAELGQPSLIASDLVMHLPAALCDVQRGR